MPLTDGGYEKHARRMHDPADHDSDCQADNEGAGSNRAEVKKASHEQRDVLRSIAVSANCLRKRCLRYCGIAAAFAPNSRNVEAQSPVEDDEEGDTENDCVIHGPMRLRVGCLCCLTFDMSGGPKGAKRPLGRPLDGGVRRQARHAQAPHLSCSLPDLPTKRQEKPTDDDCAHTCPHWHVDRFLLLRGEFE